MGASLAQALRHAIPDLDIFICDRSETNLTTAREMGLGSGYSSSLSDAADHAEIIFICVPVRSIGQVVAELAPYLKPGTIISDIGSVKGSVIKDVEAVLPDHCHFVPGHPVAGRESSGPENGIAHLFDNRNYVFTPTANTDRAALAAVRDLIARLNVKEIIEIDAQTHDRILGFTSHMPHVIAFCTMIESVRLSEELNEKVARFNGGSYQDMTRVAAADVTMWSDIFLTNSKPITQTAKNMIAQLENFISMLEKQDEKGIIDLISQARANKLK